MKKIISDVLNNEIHTQARKDFISPLGFHKYPEDNYNDELGWSLDL